MYCGGEVETSPFSALASLLAAASACWNQVLNFVDEDIETHQDVTAEMAPAALAQVRFDLSLVYRFQGIIQQDLEALSADSAWQAMRTADATGMASAMNGSHGIGLRAPDQWRAVTRDYENLLTRCRSLVQRCESASQVLQSSLIMLEHQKSQAKTDKVNRLTRMSLFFFPASLVVTFFSMDVVEMDGPNKPKLWLVMLILVIAVALSWVTYYSPRILSGMRYRSEPEIDNIV
jgi:hypothetical protein